MCHIASRIQTREVQWLVRCGSGAELAEKSGARIWRREIFG